MPLCEFAPMGMIKSRTNLLALWDFASVVAGFVKNVQNHAH